LEQSTDLRSWDAGSIQLVEESEAGSQIQRTVRLAAPVSEKSPAYIRIKTSRL
jgi:hypothetical protein